MELKIGDKVRYLDAVGGGVITAFKGKDLVMVMEEDGFETPVLRRQCVVVTPEPQAVNTPKPGVGPTSVIKPTPERETAPTKLRETPPQATINRRPLFKPLSERLVVKLAFLPEEDMPFNDAGIECYLINDSPYDLLYNYAQVSNQAWWTVQSGTVEPNTKLYLETIARNTLNDRGAIGLQVLAFKLGGFYKGRAPLSKEIRLETVKFYKIHCFKQNPYFDEDALIQDVFDE